MTTKADTAISSGARHVDESQHLATGLEQAVPARSLEEQQLSSGVSREQVTTTPGDLVLSMLSQGDRVQVRVGSSFNAAETFEAVFDSAEDANSALIDAGVLTPEQSPNPSQLAGKGIALHGISTQQLVEAGLRQRSTPSL